MTADPGVAVPQPTALYRWFDAEDVLLYAGISDDLATRENSHIRRSLWMQFAVRSAIERYPSRKEAKAAERTAIETEHPIFNKQYNNGPEAIARLDAYLETHPLAEPDSAASPDVNPRLLSPMLNPNDTSDAPVPTLRRRTPDEDDDDYGLFARGSAACREDSGRENSCRIEVMCPGQPTKFVYLHIFDGMRCAIAILDPPDARAIAEALSRHADIAENPPYGRNDRRYTTNFAISRPRAA